MQISEKSLFSAVVGPATRTLAVDSFSLLSARSTFTRLHPAPSADVAFGPLPFTAEVSSSAALTSSPRLAMSRHQKEIAPDDADFRRRFRELLGKDRHAIKNLEQTSGIKSNTLRSYLKEGGPEPARPKLAAIAQAFGVSLDWLVAGRGQKSLPSFPLPREVPVQSVIDLPSGEYVWPPFYPDVRASAGSGANVGDEVSERPFAIRADWLRRELAKAPGDLALVNVDGDSMEPTLYRGDTILLDCGDLTPRDGVFVLHRDEHLHVKRLQFRETGRVRVISDNWRLYPPYDLDLKGKDRITRIVGRVLGMAHRI